MTQAASNYRSHSRDTVEALTFLTAPADVTLTVGAKSYSFAAPAGMSAHLVPLCVGTVRATVVRDSDVILSAVSGTPVVDPPVRDDKQYLWTLATAAASTRTSPATRSQPSTVTVRRGTS
jgi:hypothetical protein